MFKKILIANRGAIAVRICRTLKAEGISSLVIYAENDRDSLHVKQADQAVSLGSGNLSQTYLNAEKIIAIALEQGAEAIHPGTVSLVKTQVLSKAVKLLDWFFSALLPSKCGYLV